MFRGDLVRNSGFRQDMAIYGGAVILGGMIVLMGNVADMREHPAAQSELGRLAVIAEQMHDIGVQWARYDIR